MIVRYLDNGDTLIDAEALAVQTRIKPETIKRALTPTACDPATRRNLYSLDGSQDTLARITPRRRR